MRGLSLVAASGGHSSSRCAGLSLSRPLLLRRTGSRRAGSVVMARSVVVAHGPSCSAACGIFPDQGSNPCPLHWQADSQPLHHQGSPRAVFLMYSKCKFNYTMFNWQHRTLNITMLMKWHVNKVGSYWLELEETQDATKSKEGKFKKRLPQNRLCKKQMLLVPYFLTYEHFAELTET